MRERESERRGTPLERNPEKTQLQTGVFLSNTLFLSVNSLFREKREEEKQQKRWRREGRGGEEEEKPE